MFSSLSHFWLGLNLANLFVYAVSNLSKSKVPHACPGLIFCYGGLVYSGWLCLSAAVPYQPPRLTHFCHWRCDVAGGGQTAVYSQASNQYKRLLLWLRAIRQKGCQSFCKPTMLSQICHLDNSDCSIKDNMSAWSTNICDRVFFSLSVSVATLLCRKNFKCGILKLIKVMYYSSLMIKLAVFMTYFFLIERLKFASQDYLSVKKPF